MRYIFSERAWDDYLYWQKTDRKTLNRINALLKEVARTPFSGTGKPEPLKYALSGYWSRRVTRHDRIVYRVEGDAVPVAQIRYHY